ncbi:MAG: nucleotidyltransferase family protein [Spiribacter salinus]|uniref:Nucleotidyltransferase family protein n=1 Tax=Spiribacter salinus TaxID=1335746 RepID=A0A540VRM4_9GAMM|nr:MAG: nucleotidyltransferase family protein [Spiribacter salinus]
MKPSAVLQNHRQAIREAAQRYPVANARIFGSVVAGTDHEGSDLDILVDALPSSTLLDLGGLQEDIEQITGLSVDILTPSDIPESYRNAVLESARSL